MDSDTCGTEQNQDQDGVGPVWRIWLFYVLWMNEHIHTNSVCLFFLGVRGVSSKDVGNKILPELYNIIEYTKLDICKFVLLFIHSLYISDCSWKTFVQGTINKEGSWTRFLSFIFRNWLVLRVGSVVKPRFALMCFCFHNILAEACQGWS